MTTDRAAFEGIQSATILKPGEVELRGPYPSPIPGVCGRCGGTGMVHGPGQNGNWTDERCDCTWPVGACCDMHNRHCEGPGDLCCWSCTEDDHPWHRDGSLCVLAEDVVVKPSEGSTDA